MMIDEDGKDDGGGRSRDAEGVRRRVLAAGRRVFAERGFSGTSLRQVAESAGISTGLLQYHFGSKQALYDAVRGDALRDYIESQRAQLEMPEPLMGSFLERSLRQYLQYMEAHPEWMRLSTWSVLEGHIQPWPLEMEFLDTLASRIEAAKEAGAMRPDLDTELLMILLASIMSGWVGYRVRHASRLEHLGSQEDRDEAYIELCSHLFGQFLIR